MLKHAWVLLGTAMLAGCATGPDTVAAAPGALKDVIAVEVRNTVGQDELLPAPPERIHPGTGALGQALVDAREHQYRLSAVRKIGPLFAAIDDVDVRGQLQQGVALGVRQGLGIDAVHVKTTPVLLEADELAQLRTALKPGTALLDVTSEYELSLNALRVEMESRAKLYRAGSDRPVHANRYFYQSAPVAGGTSAYLLWADNGGERYRAVVAEGAGEIARMMALDLAGTAAPVPIRSMTFEMRNGASRAKPVTGVVLLEQNGRVILRADSGGLYSFAK